jgi:ABC-2 type transport system permease protein
MSGILREIYSVAWGDIRFMRHNFLNITVAALVSPILYLIAFGYGMGQGVIMDGVPYIAFIIPGIVSLSSLNSSFSSTATRLNVQRLYYRSFDEMMMCPLRISSIVMGKTVLGFTRGIISCFLIFILGLFLTDLIKFTPLFFISLILSCVTFSLLGEMSALLAKSHQSMATFNTLIILPMTFLCGTFFSVGKLPDVFQYILYAIPLTHASGCIRAGALGWTFPWASFAVMAGFCVLFFLINYRLVKTRRV